MKANRKFVEGNEEGVSAVIGVILMVAITVAIAATVYVYVSGMIGGGQEAAPNVAFSKTSDKITVSKADSGLDWNDFIVSYDATLTAVRFNGGAGNIADGAVIVAAAGTALTAGDYINITGTGDLSVIHTPTNSLLGTWTFS